MKKLLYVSTLFFFVLFLSGCEGFVITEITSQDTSIVSTVENTTIDISTDSTEIDVNEEIYAIYELAFQSGAFTGAYDEWLESVRGPQGDPGREVELQLLEGYIQWRYIGDTEWQILLDISSLTGEKGESGIGIKDIFINDDREFVFVLTDNTEINLDIFSEEYTVRFFDYNGYLLDIQFVSNHEELVPPTPPQRDGFIFTGWSESIDLIDSDLRLYAEYEESNEDYTLTIYDEDGLIGIYTYEDIANEVFSDDIEMRKEGYEIDGELYKDETYNEKYSFDELWPLEKDYIGYVKWFKIYNNPNENLCEISEIDGVYICEKDIYAFNTINNIKVYYDSEKPYDVDEVFDFITNTIQDYSELFDPYNQYDNINNLYTINNTEGPVVINQMLFDAISYALNVQRTAVANEQLLFNIAYHPVLKIWQEAGNSSECNTENINVKYCPVPSQDNLNKEFNIDIDDIILNENLLTVDFLEANMGINLDVFAKSYISMILENYLLDRSLNYIINLGNDNILTGGLNIAYAERNSHNIGLRTPDIELPNAPLFGYITIEDNYSIVTRSMMSYAFMNIDMDDEKYYNNIIDPRTNYPGGNALSITVISKDTELAGIYSKTVFLLSYEQALEFVNSIDGLEAIWYYSSEDIRMSSGMTDIFYPM